MSGTHDAVVDAVEKMLGELPWEFSQDPATSTYPLQEFRVIKKSNIRRVHEGLWAIQEYLGMTDGD